MTRLIIRKQKTTAQVELDGNKPTQRLNLFQSFLSWAVPFYKHKLYYVINLTYNTMINYVIRNTVIEYNYINKRYTMPIKYNNTNTIYLHHLLQPFILP